MPSQGLWLTQRKTKVRYQNRGHAVLLPDDNHAHRIFIRQYCGFPFCLRILAIQARYSELTGAISAIW